MTIVNATILRNNFADSLKEVSKKKEYLLVARRGRITSALVNIELFEDLLALANKDYVESVRQARKEYEKGDVFSHQQVFGDV